MISSPELHQPFCYRYNREQVVITGEWLNGREKPIGIVAYRVPTHNEGPLEILATLNGPWASWDAALSEAKAAARTAIDKKYERASGVWQASPLYGIPARSPSVAVN